MRFNDGMYAEISNNEVAATLYITAQYRDGKVYKHVTQERYSADETLAREGVEALLAKRGLVRSHLYDLGWTTCIWTSEELSVLFITRDGDEVLRVDIAADDTTLIEKVGQEIEALVVEAEPAIPDGEARTSLWYLYKTVGGLRKYKTETTRWIDEFAGLDHYEDTAGLSMGTYHNEMMSLITNKQSGVHLIFGPPGTGKTRYILHLLSELSVLDDHNIDGVRLLGKQSDWMGDRELAQFLIHNYAEHGKKTCVLYVEDGESLLASHGTRTSIVSDLLNMIDGPDGNMNLHLIATINSGSDKIDPAFLRDGRLLSARYFGALSPERATRLGDGTVYEEPVTVAALLNKDNLSQQMREIIGYSISQGALYEDG